MGFEDQNLFSNWLINDLDVLVLLSAELQVDHNGVRSNAANLHALHRCLYITILNLDRSKRLATRCEPIDGDHKRVASVIAAALLGHPSGVVKDVDRYLQLRHRVVHGLGALGVGRLHGGALHALLRRVAAHPPRIGQSRLGNRGGQRQWGLLSSRHDLGGFGEIVEAQLVVVGVVASFLDQREVRIGCGCCTAGNRHVLVLLSAELQVDHNGVRSNAANLHALHRCLYITILNLDRSKRLATRCEPIDGDHKRVASVIAAALLGHPSGVVKDVDRYLQLRHRVVHGLGALGVGRLHGAGLFTLFSDA
nr:hypothetical protein Iba_chr14aCG8300 [Ipomoea batatas]